MTGFESFVGIDPWTALFTFCNMMITFAVLKSSCSNRSKKMIDDRQAEIDIMYADADAAKQKAAELEQEYQQHLQSIRMNAIRFCVRQPPAPRSAKKKLLARPVPKQPPCAPLLKLILHRNARKQSTT